MDDILLELGYLRSESLVYKSLLELGPSTAGVIAKESGLNRGSVYKALGKLINDGLVNYATRSGRKTFRAANPAILKSSLEERKKRILGFEKQIPLLLEEYKNKKEKIQVSTYEGIKGLKALAEEFLRSAKKGGEWLVLGAPKKAELLGGYYEELNKRRMKKKIKLKIVYNKNAELFYQRRNRQPLTEIRIMRENFLTPCSIEVLDDRIAIILYSPLIICFSIENKEIACSFQQYFRAVWGNSRVLTKS